MSFDICFSMFDREEPLLIPRLKLLARFEDCLAGDDGDGDYRLAFDEGRTMSELALGNNTMIDGFVVRQPPDYSVFWNIVAGILRDFPCLLYWPGTPPASIVGSMEMLQHIPKYFIEHMGIPWVSTDPERIRQYVWENS
jgi:hypothetical protein